MVRVNVISKGSSTRNWDQTCGSELYYCQFSGSGYYCFWHHPGLTDQALSLQRTSFSIRIFSFWEITFGEKLARNETVKPIKRTDILRHAGFSYSLVVKHYVQNQSRYQRPLLRLNQLNYFFDRNLQMFYENSCSDVSFLLCM